MSAELIILGIMLPFVIILTVAISYFIYKFLKFEREFPIDLGKKIRANKAIGGTLQKQMNELVETDISSFIDQHPIMLDIFPSALPKAIEQKQLPSFLASIVSILGPALLSTAVNQGSNIQPGSIAAQAVANPDVLSGIVKFFNSWRENAKKNYVPKQTTTTDHQPSREGYVKAEGY